jgi:hypothetical protein
VFRLGVLVLIGAALFVFHGIHYYLSPWSQAVINGIVKYTYQQKGQAETTVVLFREDNLASLKESYPVPYGRHAMILEAIAAYQPRAIFMDFVFLDERPGIDDLRQAICDLRDAKIPVYLAVLAPMRRPVESPNALAEAKPKPWVFECAMQASARMAPVEGASGVLTYAHGLWFEKNRDGRWLEENHKDKGKDEQAVEKMFVPTPAFAMASERLKQDPVDVQDMEIIWGNGVAKLNEHWMSACSRSGSWLSHLVGIFSNNPWKSVKLQCPYTRTVTVGQLLLSSGDHELADAIRGSAVFYGAAFKLSGDRVASPVFEELPGVYLHAMAYDNLVTLRGDYKRAERQFPVPSLLGRNISIPLTGLVDTVLLFVTVLILLLVEEPPPAVQRVRERFAHLSSSRKWLVLGLIAGLVLVAIRAEASVWAALGLLLLMIAITVLDLAPPAERPPESLQGFVLRRLLALIVPLVAVLAFIGVDRWLGLDAALLLIVVPGYFLYRVVVSRDMLFAATATLMVLAAVVLVHPPVNLGPRNVIAYVTFFEAARMLLKHADGVANQYFKLRARHPEDSEWGWARPLMPALDWVFAVCGRTVVSADTKRESKEETHAKHAGAPA